MDYDHPQHIKCWHDVGDFKNRGTPKSSILIVFSIMNHHLGEPPFMEPPWFSTIKPSSYWDIPPSWLNLGLCPGPSPGLRLRAPDAHDSLCNAGHGSCKSCYLRTSEALKQCRIQAKHKGSGNVDLDLFGACLRTIYMYTVYKYIYISFIYIYTWLYNYIYIYIFIYLIKQYKHIYQLYIVIHYMHSNTVQVPVELHRIEAASSSMKEKRTTVRSNRFLGSRSAIKWESIY